jgi:Spy/CpxP family protein refolding chaperone
MWKGRVLAGIALVGLSSLMWAQKKGRMERGEGDGKGRIAHLVTYLTDTLKLTPDQQGKVRQILENHAAKAREIRRSDQDGRAKQEALRQLRQQTDAAIGEVLTPEQQALWEKIKHDWRRKARERWEKRTGQRLPEED